MVRNGGNLHLHLRSRIINNATVQVVAIAAAIILAFISSAAFFSRCLLNSANVGVRKRCFFFNSSISFSMAASCFKRRAAALSLK